MSILSNCLRLLVETDVRLEAFDRSGSKVRDIDGRQFATALRHYREEFRALSPTDDPPRIALLFRSEETVEFLVASLAAMAEGFIVVPLYPNWDAATQRTYLELYRMRHLVVGSGFADRAASWGDLLDRVVRIDLDPIVAKPSIDLEPGQEIFPELERDRACAWIFTSGTSGKLAKCTEITAGNLDAAIENIRSLEFLREGMVVHSPLSASHIFAFVVILAFLALKPRRIIFSDVQYLSRLPEEVTGKVDALILVPIVLNRLRGGIYERLLHGCKQSQRAADPLGALPRPVRRTLRTVVRAAEEAVLRRERRERGWLHRWPNVWLARTALGRKLRSRLGSPDFVVVGGAKPDLRSMAFLEALGVRCLQGWGMTETTGPLAVCSLFDRFSGAFGTCGNLFPSTVAHIEDGELIVGGPQIARGYVEPDGKLLPFEGTKRTGDSAIFDKSGRLCVLGKASDRITTDNGLNYDPRALEEELEHLDLESEHRFEQIVVIGDGKPRLGAVFFPRDPLHTPREKLEAHARELIRRYNTGRPVDEVIGPFTVSHETLAQAGGLGPSGKLVRRRIEEAFEHLYGGALV